MRAVVRAGTPLIGIEPPPAVLWHQRVQAVGPGLAARRIFADLAHGPNSQIKLVEEAHAPASCRSSPTRSAVTPPVPPMASTTPWRERAAAKLASYNRPTAVTFWHEPHGDMTPRQYVAGSRQLLPIFQRAELRVGPILNGWLLDNQVSTFAQYCPESLFRIWQWVGSTPTSPGPCRTPVTRSPRSGSRRCEGFVRARGHKHALGVGEYNGYSAKSIADAGERLLSTPDVWFGCMWNSTGGKGYASPARASPRSGTLADPRQQALTRALSRPGPDRAAGQPTCRSPWMSLATARSSSSASASRPRTTMRSPSSACTSYSICARARSLTAFASS